MKIVQINSVCDVGSTGRIAADLARRANDEGDNAICAYGRSAIDAGDIKVIRIGADIDVYWHIMMTRLFDMHGLASKRATKKFLQQMDDFKPDMFHLHNLHGYYINYELLFEYIKTHDIKVLWTFHDSWPFTGHCAEPVCYDCMKWKTDACTGCAKTKEYPKSFFSGRSSENFDRKKKAFLGVKDLKIITPSNWLAGLVKESFLGGYEVETVHNTIDTEIFKPTKSDFRKNYSLNGKVVYLCVSFAWHDDKLLSLLKMTKAFRNDEILVLVGIGNREEKMIMSNEKVIGIKKTDSKEELAGIYTAADVFINPSVKADNYPTVNLEAQACGTYVVTYDTGGVAETITEGMGVAVPYGNIEALLVKAREFVGKKI